MQCRRQAGLITLIARQDDVVIELRRTGMAVLARRSSRHSRTFRGITSDPATMPSRATCEPARMSIRTAQRAEYFTRRLDPDRETRRMIAKLEALGHTVSLQPAAA